MIKIKSKTKEKWTELTGKNGWKFLEQEQRAWAASMASWSSSSSEWFVYQIPRGSIAAEKGDWKKWTREEMCDWGFPLSLWLKKSVDLLLRRSKKNINKINSKRWEARKYYRRYENYINNRSKPTNPVRFLSLLVEIEIPKWYFNF